MSSTVGSDRTSARFPDRSGKRIPDLRADRTTRARIRDAAIARFPQDGFAGTTVRDIAADAGVSPALVIHHFGSKSRLREACDHHVIEVLGETKRQALHDGTYRQGGTLAALYQVMEPITRYLAWALGSGGESSQRIFDELLEDVIGQLRELEADGLMSPMRDRHRQAATLLVMQLGPLVLHEHFSRTMGVDTLSAEGMLTTAPFMLRIFSGELVNPQFLSEVGSALAEVETRGSYSRKRK